MGSAHLVKCGVRVRVRVMVRVRVRVSVRVRVRVRLTTPQTAAPQVHQSSTDCAPRKNRKRLCVRCPTQLPSHQQWWSIRRTHRPQS